MDVTLLPHGLFTSLNASSGDILLRTLRQVQVSGPKLRAAGARCGAARAWLSNFLGTRAACVTGVADVGSAPCSCTCRGFGVRVQPADVNGRDSVGSSGFRTRRASGDGGSRGRVTAIPEVEDVETTRDLWSRGILHSNSRYKLLWDCCMIIAVLYIAVEVPLVVGYSLDLDGISFAFERLVDAMFGLDMLLTMRTAYLDHRSELLVTVPHRIMNAYMARQFWVDLLATLPFDSIVSAAMSRASIGSGVRTLKLIRFVRLLRVLRLTKLLRFTSYLNGISRFVVLRPALVQLTLLVFQVFFCVHVLGCFFAFTASVSDDPRAWWGYAATKSGSSVLASDSNASLGSMYLAGIYFAITTASTTGYGDIYGGNDSERMYLVWAMLLSVIVFGYTIGTVASLWSEMNASSSRYSQRMAEVTTYIREHRLPPELGHRLKSYYERFLSRRSAFNEDDILSELSDNLRREVVLYLNKDIISSIPFFASEMPHLDVSGKRVRTSGHAVLPPEGPLSPAAAVRDASRRFPDTSFVFQIISVLKPQYAGPGDFIIRQGDAATEMFFISSGRAEVLEKQRVVLNRAQRRNSKAGKSVLGGGASNGDGTGRRRSLLQPLFAAFAGAIMRSNTTNTTTPHGPKSTRTTAGASPTRVAGPVLHVRGSAMAPAAKQQRGRRFSDPGLALKVFTSKAPGPGGVPAFAAAASRLAISPSSGMQAVVSPSRARALMNAGAGIVRWMLTPSAAVARHQSRMFSEQPMSSVDDKPANAYTDLAADATARAGTGPTAAVEDDADPGSPHADSDRSDTPASQFESQAAVAARLMAHQRLAGSKDEAALAEAAQAALSASTADVSDGGSVLVMGPNGVVAGRSNGSGGIGSPPLQARPDDGGTAPAPLVLDNSVAASRRGMPGVAAPRRSSTGGLTSPLGTTHTRFFHTDAYNSRGRTVLDMVSKTPTAAEVARRARSTTGSDASRQFFASPLPDEEDAPGTPSRSRTEADAVTDTRTRTSSLPNATSVPGGSSEGGHKRATSRSVTADLASPASRGTRARRGQREVVMDVIVATLDSGAYFGELSVIMNAAHAVSVRAATHVSMFALEREELRKLVDLYPSVGARLADSIDAFAKTVASRVPIAGDAAAADKRT